jgi:hypothetical protein
VSKQRVLELLFADDMAIVCHTQAALQEAITKLAKAVSEYGLIISLEKTEVLATKSVNARVEEQDRTQVQAIKVGDRPLKVVEQFKYLGSVISGDGSMDAEIDSRIKKAAAVFGRLWERVWKPKDINTTTKVAVYRAMVVSTLLYGCCTWTTKKRQVQRLHTFHMRCLRRLLNIRWQDRITDAEVLRRAGGLWRVETMLRFERLSWLGHVGRMNDERLPKQMLFGELCGGRRRVGKPKGRWKDGVMGDLKHYALSRDTWYQICQNRPQWRKLLHQRREYHHRAKNRAAEEKRRKRKAAEQRAGLRCQRAAIVQHVTAERDRRMRQEDV